MIIEYRVLGGPTVAVDGVDCSPTAPKVRQVMALLLANANHVVQAETIMMELWGETRPASATTTTQTYVYHLRKLFAHQGIEGPHGEALTTRGKGYVLDIDPQCLDEHNFRELVQRAQTHFYEGRYREASGFVGQAMRIWQGLPYCDVEQGYLLEAHAVNLEELYTRAVELRIESNMSLGMHREMIGELRTLVAQKPLNEWLYGRLIEALGRAGRRSEALDAYQTMRQVLDWELGLNPSEESRRLQAEVLNA